MTYNQLKNLLDTVDFGEYGNEDILLDFIFETTKGVKQGKLSGVVFDEPFKLIGEETNKDYF